MCYIKINIGLTSPSVCPRNGKITFQSGSVVIVCDLLWLIILLPNLFLLHFIFTCMFLDGYMSPAMACPAGH